MKKIRILSVLLALCLLLGLFAATSCSTLSQLAPLSGETTAEVVDTEPAATGEADETAVAAKGFEVTFVPDANVTVTVFATQDDLSDGENGETTNTAYSRSGDTGALTQDGTGQVSFLLTFAEGYTLDSITVANEDGYNNLKGSADTGVANGYRITKITADLTVTVTAKAESAAEDLSNGYAVTFALSEHISVVAYRTQDLTAAGTQNATVAYSRDSATGALTRTDGQVNFVLVFEEGYELDGAISIEGSYKNLKDVSADTGVANAYRITKIASDLTVTVNAKRIAA